MNGEKQEDWTQRPKFSSRIKRFLNRISKLFKRPIPYARTWFKVTHTWAGSPIGSWDMGLYLPWMNQKIPVGSLARLNPRIVQ